MSLDRLSLEHAATDGSRDPILRAATKVGAVRPRRAGTMFVVQRHKEGEKAEPSLIGPVMTTGGQS